MKTTLLTPKRLLLEFPTRKEMTLSNFRISEFKEGKDGIKGKCFTPDEFIDIYSDENGDLDYFSYWEGFNYSKQELLDFKEVFKGFTSNRENNIFTASLELENDGYIICMEQGDETTLRHELAHAYFFDNKEYREKAIEIVNSLDLGILERYKNHLRDMDYGDDCLIDECHAYMVAWDSEEWEECFPSIKIEEIETQSHELGVLFDKYNQ